MSATNVAVNGLATMEEVVLMATLLVSCVKNTTIAIAMTHAKRVTCAISTHAKEQIIPKGNVHILTYGMIRKSNLPYQMSNRIDLTQFEKIGLYVAPEWAELIAELKRMYEREDALVSAIKELCDSEDSTGCSGDLTVVSLDPMLKLYELTSE